MASILAGTGDGDAWIRLCLCSVWLCRMWCHWYRHPCAWVTQKIDIVCPLFVQRKHTHIQTRTVYWVSHCHSILFLHPALPVVQQHKIILQNEISQLVWHHVPPHTCKCVAGCYVIKPVTVETNCSKWYQLVITQAAASSNPAECVSFWQHYGQCPSSTQWRCNLFANICSSSSSNSQIACIPYSQRENK